MKLATIRTQGTTRAVRVDPDALVELGEADLGDVLAADGWQQRAAEAAGPRHSLEGAEYATLVARPSKVFCVGLNYRNHIEETGHTLPTHPTLFQKFPDTLIGAGDDIACPPETEKFDWEAELVVVVGRQVRRATEEQAIEAIAGFTIMNDITCRDWQVRTQEWLQGKNWYSSTPVGPVMVTPDELGGVRPACAIRCSVDGEVMQDDTTADLLFDPVRLVQYCSTIIRLNPGDMIATGTPGGVGNARDPQVFLRPGQLVETSIEGIGVLRNRVVAEQL